MSHHMLTMQAPWAWLMFDDVLMANGQNKDVENRDWKTTYRGRVAIVAGGFTTVDYELCKAWLRVHHISGYTHLPPMQMLPLGGVIGVAELTDCVERLWGSDWFIGKYGFRFTEMVGFGNELIPCAGSQLRFPPAPPAVEREIRRRLKQR